MGSVSTVLLVAALWLGYAWYTVERTVHRDLGLIAERSAAEIDHYLKGRTDALVAARETLSYPEDDRYKLQMILKRLVLRFDGFRRLVLFDPSWAVVTDSDSGGEMSLQEEMRKTVSGGKDYRSSLRLAEGNLPYIRVAYPIFRQGEVYRILVADVNILDVWDRIDDIRIGQTGRAAILSADGVFVAHPHKERVLKGERWQDLMKTDVPVAGEGALYKAISPEGRALHVASAAIPSEAWMLLIMQERQESYHFLYVMLFNAFAVIIICLVSAYFIADRLSRRLSSPIEALHLGVDEIGRGNFGYRVPALRGKEMSALGAHLNEMAKTLEEKAEGEKRAAELERLAAVGRLASDVAHEINNPLAIIKNHVFITQREREKMNEPVDMTLSIVGEEINRIVRIIDSFRQFYKGQRTDEIGEINPLPPLRAVISLCGRDMEARKIDLDVALDADGMVMADHDKLEQVFLNLIKNAMEAMPEGGRISIGSLRRDDGMLVISVADTGQGIKAEHLPRLFDPFFTTKGVKGTGLGLSVTYGIIKSFGGEIEVESEAGKGATFRVVLPLVSSGE